MLEGQDVCIPILLISLDPLQEHLVLDFRVCAVHERVEFPICIAVHLLPG